MNARTTLSLVTLMLAGCIAPLRCVAAIPTVDPRATNDFLTYHPDMANRKIGMDAYQHGKFVTAAEYFQRAARYGDKASDAMLADMFWNGNGVEKNRPRAYAWIDLAAERGYPSLVAIRERYWQQLSATEQAHAIEAGQQLYAAYGDSVAEPRLASELRRGLLGATGSHVGFVGTLAIHTPTLHDNGLSGSMTSAGTPGDQYYASQYWNIQEYVASEDAVWHAPQRHGVVDVGALQQVRDAGTPASDGSGLLRN